MTQGVTTVVINPDGGGPISIAAQKDTLQRLGIGLNRFVEGRLIDESVAAAVAH